MCFIPGLDPFTIMSVAGTAISAAGAIAQGQQSAALAEAQAQALEVQGKNEERASGFEAVKTFEEGRRATSAARAQVGASGLGFGGSAAEVIAGNAGRNQIDIEAIRWGANIRQNNLRTEAGISRMQGKAAKQAGMIGAAGSIVGGLSQLYDPARSLRLGQSPFAAGQGGLV